MEIARAEGVEECTGAEIVAELCGKNVTHLAGGATDLPFDDCHFDLVTAMDVLEHLAEEEVAQAVREAWRVARHRVFFGTPHKQDNLGLHLTVRDRAWWHACLVEVAGDEDRVIVIDLPIPSHKQPHTFFELRKQEQSTD